MSTPNGETDAATGLLDTDAVMRPFLDILKDGSSVSKMNLSTVRSLALKTFAHPQIFCGFDEFKSRCSPLLLPQGETAATVASSSNSHSLFNTLDLFSFGSLKDYKNRQHRGQQQQQQQTDNNEYEYYLPLNEPALAKLSQLTVLTSIQHACFNGETSISYDSLAEALGLTTVTVAAMQEDGASSSTSTTTTTTTTANNIRDVEDVLIRCLYANVLKGKLCQKTRCFGWQGECLPVVSSRDVPSTQISNLLSALQGLGQRLEESGNDAAEAQEQVTQGLEETAHYWKTLQQSKNKTALEESSRSKSGGGNGGGGPSSSSSSRLFGGGRQGPGGFWGHGNTTGTSDTSGGGGGGGGDPSNNPRKSSKRSRGGIAAGFRMM